MKALSVRQPWATLLCQGLKSIELRPWPTQQRGQLLICASKIPSNVFWHEDDEHRLLHAGCMIGIVEVIDCRPMEKDDEEDALSEFDPNAYAWVVSPVCGVRPDSMASRPGLFDVPDQQIVRLKGADWQFNYPCPQGDIRPSKTSPSGVLGTL